MTKHEEFKDEVKSQLTQMFEMGRALERGKLWEEHTDPWEEGYLAIRRAALELVPEKDEMNSPTFIVDRLVATGYNSCRLQMIKNITGKSQKELDNEDHATVT